MDKKNLKNIVIAGGIFFAAAALLYDWDEEQAPSAYKNPGNYPDWEIDNAMADKPAGVMTEIEEVGKDQYRIVNEYPSKNTGVTLRRLDGSVEPIPQEKIEGLMANAPAEGGTFALGPVLAGGLLGYMMGKNAGISPNVYKNSTMYSQALANRTLVEQRIKEEENKRQGWSGRSYYYGMGRRYDGRDHYLRGGAGGAVMRSSGRTGFFGRMFGGRGFSG
jgi:hypothetical protein